MQTINNWKTGTDISWAIPLSICKQGEGTGPRERERGTDDRTHQMKALRKRGPNKLVLLTRERSRDKDSRPAVLQRIKANTPCSRMFKGIFLVDEGGPEFI